MGVSIKDNNDIPQILRVIKELSSKRVEVGVFGDDDSHLLMIARVHEYGTDIEVTDKMRGWFAYQGYPLKEETTEINIPERSFVRSTFDQEVTKLERNVENLLYQALNLKISPQACFERIGEWMASRIQRTIEEIDDPPKSQMTLERDDPMKDNPLISSGRLYQSITWRVV
ncbi:hypothetical protein J2S78_002062 [Salibacterium salarium]|uniref:hypothetical protein n=1 Tax=Salibacterium salarium TaxID=284579 RepID=UPI00277EEF9F|nr:hypothetical protein [Salibacterium salarium]MDQ0299642.1 hypothetical protein [Salibacterium salarium]